MFLLKIEKQPYSLQTQRGRVIATSKKLLLSVVALLLIGGFLLSLGCGRNNPPMMPSDPEPPDGVTIPVGSVTLCWCGGDPDPELPYYDVYFGDSTPPPLEVVNILERSYEITDLESNTTYYWMIVAQDEAGDTCCGPIWSFKTQAGDPYEPNDWFDEAYGPLEFGRNYKSFISERHDVDFYYFIPSLNGKATIELSDLPADYDLYLCDGSENLLVYSQNGKLDNESVSYQVNGWERYYVIVRPCEACDSENPYTLKISFEETRTDSYEPNDWFNEAYGPLEFGTVYESWIWDWEDYYDIYYFIPDSSGIVKIDLYSLPADYDLALFDENQEELDWSSKWGPADESISYYVTGSELYYVVVILYDRPDSRDSYLLKVDYIQTQDSYEPNNSFDEVYGPLDFEMTYESWISTWDDVDFYYFVPASDGWIGIDLYSLPEDYDLYLCDSNYDLIDVSDNEANYDEWIEFEGSAYETYYVVVVPFEEYDPVDSYCLEVYYSYGSAQTWGLTHREKRKLKID